VIYLQASGKYDELLCVSIFLMLLLVSSILYACSQILATREPTEPRFYDPRIRSELVTSGLSSPTSIFGLLMMLLVAESAYNPSVIWPQW
jgi:hypothetical protein